jgi:aminoglycoside phosphotransferase (APT) family kinase protein
MGKVGRWIDVFQAADRAGNTVSVDGLKQYIDVRLARLADHRSADFTRADRARVLRHIDWLAEQIPERDLVEVPVHSDMALGNILASGERVVVLDFAMAKRGSRLHDLTRVYVQMALLGLKPQIRTSTLQRLQRALLAGFDPGLSDLTPLFRLSVLLHRVNHLATVTVKRSSVAESLYNRLVRRQHARWISAELARSTMTCIEA